MNDSTVLGIDIGGSHLTCALVDMGTRTIINGSIQRGRVNSGATLENIIETWSAVICQSLGSNNFSEQKIGIAIPGPFDYENGVSYMKDNDKYDALYGLNIKTLLSQKLNMKAAHIFMMNDAACFLKGEIFAGAAIGFISAIGVILGTGLGTARYNGETAEDANLWCSPFRNGIAEDYISTRWFVKRYLELSGNTVDGVKELAASYHTDKNVQVIFDEFAINLADFLATFIKNTGPQVVVLGGNIMHNENLFLPQLKKLLQNEGLFLPVVRATLGEDAAILGASSLV